jgi:hypothetical protein
VASKQLAFYQNILRGRRTITMTNLRSENDLDRTPSKYRLPLVVGMAGLILLVVGFLLPVQGWNALLMVLGFILLFAAAFSIRLWFIGDWIPTLLAEKERGKEDDIPPPPTVERWP